MYWERYVLIYLDPQIQYNKPDILLVYMKDKSSFPSESQIKRPVQNYIKYATLNGTGGNISSLLS